MQSDWMEIHWGTPLGEGNDILADFLAQKDRDVNLWMEDTICILSSRAWRDIDLRSIIGGTILFVAARTAV
jgi:hypothetical protein